VVAAGGPDAAELAAELGDGMFGTEAKAELFEHYRSAGGSGPAYGEVGLAWAEDEASAVRAAFEASRWSLTGWKVMSELPNPANFEASARYVREEDVAAQMPCGPDAERHLAAIRRYEQAGYDHVVLTNSGPDPDGFMDFFARELKPQLAG
jgi:G6PDH family F420-dependent oxidoreductase